MGYRGLFVMWLGSIWLLFNHPVSAGDIIFAENWTQLSDLTGNVVVRNGASLTVINATISGNVVVEEGGSLFASGTRIEGNLNAVDANSVVLRDSAVRASAVQGALRFCRMNGRLRIFGAQIAGRALIEQCDAVEIVVQDALFEADLQLFENRTTRAFRLSDNLILGSLQCGQGLDQPSLERNSVAAGVAKGSEIAILAKGFTGGEKIVLQVDQRPVCDWDAEADFTYFRFRSTEFLSPDRIRVASETEPPIIDDLTNGLFVDRVELDSTVYQAESPSVYCRGAAVSGMPVRPGFYQTESLPFNGFFQFGIDGLEDDLILLQLNAALPDGWKYSLFRDNSDIRLHTFDAKGRIAFNTRFGSAGVISGIEDRRSRRQLVAPSFDFENTDRVVQWTAWETGDRVVHDVPTLPWYEDRFNITQAGTSQDIYHGTAEVAMNTVRGQLDVWSVHDRQWKAELEPFIKGSLSSLTRTNVLDGGGILVRRVLRMNTVTKYGEPVTLSQPWFEAWSPFADKTLNALALELNSKGAPAWWYADSRNIPYYPQWPAFMTRGWAIAFDRQRQAKGPSIAVVFGRDAGTVIWADGSSTSPQSYELNTMDFPGGLAILPGYMPGSLPEGSIVDLSFIFLPAYGIGSNTQPTLDSLASHLPPPRAYHPGAPLSGELSVIADRLSTLHTENLIRTDNLGTVK